MCIPQNIQKSELLKDNGMPESILLLQKPGLVREAPQRRNLDKFQPLHAEGSVHLGCEEMEAQF